MIIKQLKKTKIKISEQLSLWFSEEYEKNEVDTSMIFYESRDGKNMIDSPKAMFDYLLNDPSFKDYQHIWSYVPSEIGWDDLVERYSEMSNVFFVERNTQQYVSYLSKSKYLVTNSTFQSFFVPKKEQIVINTWHGTPLKKMGYDIENANPAGSQNVVRNFLFSKYIISPNAHTSEVLKNSFRLDGIFSGEILEFGYPRNDVLQRKDNSVLKQLIDRGIDIDGSKELILYCPTWKGTSTLNPSDSLQQILAETSFLRSQVGEKYNVLVKVHPYIFNKAKEVEELNRYLVPDDFDPNYVLLVTDILLTDYSSIYFDFLVTNKPIIFYSWDSDIYESTRGMYFDENELPGPIVSTMSDVIDSINKIDQIKDEYREKYTVAKKKFVSYEDGFSTERVINYIFKNNRSSVGSVKKMLNNKEKILIYTGGMQNNGITSSLLNLLKNIDYQKYDVTCFMGNPNTREKLANVDKIPKECHLIFKPGYAILTPEENKTLRNITSKKNVDNINSELFPWKGFEREANRIFSNNEFNVAIDFSGYSFYWTKYILSSNSKKKICYMHSDMNADRQKIVNGKQVHYKSLGQLFSVYNRFDMLLAVSPVMADVNKNSLINFIPEEKISFVLNSLDLDKLYGDDVISTEKRNVNIRKVNFEIDLIDKQDVIVWETYKQEFSKRIPYKKDMKIKAIAYAKYKNNELYKILMDDIYVGWVEAEKFVKNYPTIVSKEPYKSYGYIKNVKNKVFWIDLPTSDSSKRYGTTDFYKYMYVKIVEKAILSNGDMYFHITINNEIDGWVYSNVINETIKFSRIRKIKNIYSNFHRLKNPKQFPLLTLNEEGYVKVRDIASNDAFEKAANNEDDFDFSNVKNKVLKFTKIIKNHYGVYYLIYDGNKKIGWLNKNFLIDLIDDCIVSEKKVSIEISIEQGTIKYTDCFFSNPIVNNSSNTVIVHSVIESTKGTFFSDGENFYETKDVEVIKEFGKYDLMGNFVPMPKNQDFNIITIGRLSVEKQQDKLIYAFQNFKKTIPNSKLYILGDGILREELLSIVKENNLEDSVFLLGHVSDPFTILKQCQLFTLTSAYEGQPMVLLEALSLGIPVCSTNIPASKYVLSDGKYGILSDSNDIDGIEGMLFESYSHKQNFKEFDAIKYNIEAVNMFYEKINS